MMKYQIEINSYNFNDKMISYIRTEFLNLHLGHQQYFKISFINFPCKMTNFIMQHSEITVLPSVQVDN